MATQAYDSRDDAQTKMLALKEKADKEMAQYNMELKVLCAYVHMNNNNMVSNIMLMINGTWCTRLVSTMGLLQVC